MTKDDFDPGDEWDKVTSSASSLGGSDVLRLCRNGEEVATWVEKPPPVVLPTQAYTMIRVHWSTDMMYTDGPEFVLRLDGKWLRISNGRIWSPRDLLASIAGYDPMHVEVT